MPRYRLETLLDFTSSVSSCVAEAGLQFIMEIKTLKFHVKYSKKFQNVVKNIENMLKKYFFEIKFKNTVHAFWFDHQGGTFTRFSPRYNILILTLM